jgi:PIN domain nuclease of toxin-antitoxin system
LIVLDTHTWLWYATESEKLSKQAKARIKRAETLGVHPISCLELVMLSNSGRIKLSMDTSRWIGHALERPKVELLPFTPAAAIRAAGLGGSFPGDPADRLIVGAALEMGVPVVTRDQRITEWGHVNTIW